MAGIIPKNLEKISKPVSLKNRKGKKLPPSPHGSFNKGKANELKNLSVLIHGKEELKISRSRHNSYYNTDVRNISEQNSYFQTENSNKGEETPHIVTIQIEFAGLQGNFNIGSKTKLEIIILKLSNSINLSNGVLNSMMLKIEEIGLICPNALKFKIFNSSEFSPHALEFDYNFSENEDHNTTETNISFNIEEVK